MARPKKVKYEEKTLREKKVDFKRHLRTYLVMSVFFVLLSTFTGGGWAIWPIMGWGIGVAMQGLSLYGPLRDPDDAHPGTVTKEDNEFSGPLPDIRERERMELKELDRRPYRDEDLV